jgi:hypothetical protein
MNNVDKYWTARHKVHRAALTKIKAFGNITPCRLVNITDVSEEVDVSVFRAVRKLSTLQIKAARTSDTSVATY